MKDLEEVGKYAAAYRVFENLIFIPIAFSGALFPNFSRYYVDSISKLRKAYAKSLKISFLVGLPVAVGIMMLSHKIIPLIWTEKHINSVVSLQILSWALFFSFLYSINGASLTSMNKQKVFALNSFIGVITNVGLNIFLIPRYGAEGASFATVVTEGTLFIWSFYFIRRELLIAPSFGVIVKAIIGVVFMGTVINYFDYLSLAILIPLGALVYFSSLMILRILSKEERQMLRTIFVAR